MMNDILVCLEGSASSERAIDLGIELAREHGTRLVGLAIIDEPDIRAGAAMGIGGSSYKQQRDETLLEDSRQRAEAALAQFEERCKKAGVAARSLEMRGRPAAKILEEMTEHDLTLIGRGANFVFETKVEDAATRDNILHRAHKPVIVVPEEPARSGHDVLVAFDGSSAAKRAVRAFGESGMAQGRTIHVASMDDDGEQAWEMASRGVDIGLDAAGRGRAARPAAPAGRRPAGQRRLHALAHLGDDLGLGHARDDRQDPGPAVPAPLTLVSCPRR